MLQSRMHTTAATGVWVMTMQLLAVSGSPRDSAGGPTTPSYGGATPIRGISYGPAPLKQPGVLLNDDFMSANTAMLWHDSGRGDLKIMASLGANAVRLYGNDPRFNHKGFLDSAGEHGLNVITGMSDYPYTQAPDRCMLSDYDCFDNARQSYKMNLENGFLIDGGKKYHPALKAFILLNEPDLKMGYDQWCRAVISAFDGALEAEKEMGVEENFISFTATFSFGIFHGAKPGLGQMEDLHACMKNPEGEPTSYKPKNDVLKAYYTRFVNSFNTNNPHDSVASLFLEPYKSSSFWTEDLQMPVFIGEYHAPFVPVQSDLETILEMSSTEGQYPFLLGVSFFEFSVRYDKGGSEMEFGMFGYGNKSLGTFYFAQETCTVWNLVPQTDSSGESMPKAVAAAYGGEVPDLEEVLVQTLVGGAQALGTSQSDAGRGPATPRYAGVTPIRGISYGPAPLKQPGVLLNDDFMSASTAMLWSDSGRDDLKTMAILGANAVRLYGNDPQFNHKEFLDSAEKRGLDVITGMSDYPYTQAPDRCMLSDYDCFDNARQSYKMNLENGFLIDGGKKYHPALKAFILLNEPDLKIGYDQWCRAVISAFDGVLEAEKEMGVEENLISFTATFSFGIFHGAKPGLGQMEDLHACMKNPEVEPTSYKPRNDVLKAYYTRFVNSFNTNNPHESVANLFLEPYKSSSFWTDDLQMPVFIGEYHAPFVPVQSDLEAILEMSSTEGLYPFLLGASFFEFSVRYDKGGSEMEFGMFGYGNKSLGTFYFAQETCTAWNLVPRTNSSGESIPNAVAAAYGGEVPDLEEFVVQSSVISAQLLGTYQTASGRSPGLAKPRYAGATPIRGISYGPAPRKQPGVLLNDDFMAASTAMLWSDSGRGDLKTMAILGANAVRLYGNDPQLNHKEFLDSARQHGLDVITGMSDYPYTQAPDRCMLSDYDCFDNARQSYKMNLENGFLIDGGTKYHPALKVFVLLNEPDLKMGYDQWCRAVISAFDGVLEAEKEMGVEENLISFTATFSFGIFHGAEPGLGQMEDLRTCMKNPEQEPTLYKAKNDVLKAYYTRFVNSFNTNNPHDSLASMFLESYKSSSFWTDDLQMPVFIGEYHAPFVPVQSDLEAILEMSSSEGPYPFLLGVSFFEFSVRYDKGGSEMEFGMFGYGNKSLGTFHFAQETCTAWNLVPETDSSGKSMPEAVAAAYTSKGDATPGIVTETTSHIVELPTAAASVEYTSGATLSVVPLGFIGLSLLMIRD